MQSCSFQGIGDSVTSRQRMHPQETLPFVTQCLEGGIYVLDGSIPLPVNLSSVAPTGSTNSCSSSLLMIFGTGVIIVTVKDYEGLVSSSCSIDIGQACIDARGNVPDCTCHRPDNVVDQSGHVSVGTTLGSGVLPSGTPNFLTRKDLSPFLRQPNSSMSDNGTGLSKLSKTSLSSMPHCYPTTKSRAKRASMS